MRIAIFGSNGFIGSHLSNYLSQSSCMILCMVREKSDLSKIEKLKSKYSNNKLNYCIFDPDNLDKAFKKEKIDIVINLMSYGVNQDDRNEKIANRVNVEIPVNLFKIASKYKVKNFIHFGSSQEYEGQEYICESTEKKPQSLYGKTKRDGCNACIEEYGKNKSCKLTILRPFSIYGEYESEKKLIPSLLTSIKKQTKLSLTGGLQERNYLYIEDFNKYVHLMITKINSLAYVNYNIGSSNNIQIKEISKIICDITKKSGNSLEWGKVSYRENEVIKFKADLSRLYNEIGKFEEYTMHNALQKIKNLMINK